MNLRLAERQGLLTGRHLSPVQMMALILLNHIDVIDNTAADRDAVKRSMLASGMFDHTKLFPDYFTAEEEKPGENSTHDYSQVEWMSPSDAHDEYERLMAVVGQATTGRMSGDSITGEGKPNGQVEWSEWS